MSCHFFQAPNLASSSSWCCFALSLPSPPMLRVSSAHRGDTATTGTPSSWQGLTPCPRVMARAGWDPDGDKGEPTGMSCSRRDTRLCHPRNVAVHAQPMEMKALPVPLLLSVGSRWVCRAGKGFLGWFMNSWELHWENSPFQDTPFHLPPPPPPRQPLHCPKSLPQDGLLHPGCFFSPPTVGSPLEQPRGRAPRAGARCRSALSRGRAPARSFCRVSSTSLTELTSRAMLVWLSESSCGQGTHGGTRNWG